MSYHDALNYLARKTPVIELYDQLGGRVAVCPDWNGKVLTSTNGGLDGDSFGFINVHAIDTECFEDFGGEDQWTFSPLIYSFAVESIKENRIVLQQIRQMADANGMPAELHVTRTISLLSRSQAGTLFGDAVADALKQSDVSDVGFYTENTVRSQEKAYVASRQRGMFNASPHTAVIVSMPPVSFTPEPFAVGIDYLGGAPHGRVRYLAQTLLIRTDGQKRCQVTMPFAAAPPVFGAIELRSGTLTLWTFDLPEGSSEENDVIRIYNPGLSQGLSHGGEPGLAAYYEVNCFSAVRELQPEHPLTSSRYTVHINADNSTLDGIIQQTFGVSLTGISRKMF